MVERGEDFAVYRRVNTVAAAGGGATIKTNQFTLLENCLNYFENGQWKESEDVIEPAPGGAVARRGPNKAIFSPDLNSPAVFDIQTSDGKRLRGGVRAIQLTDLATGKSVTLATVKASAPGELVPPNSVVYRDAFDGLKADVLLVWKHNYFGQDVVLRERPQLPTGMSPDTTRLEILTEMLEAPQPSIRKQMVQAGNSGQLEDDVVIHFGRLAVVMGKAYPVQDDVAWAVGGLNPSDSSSPVLKQWHSLSVGGVLSFSYDISRNEVLQSFNLVHGNRAKIMSEPVLLQSVQDPIKGWGIYPIPVGWLSRNLGTEQTRLSELRLSVSSRHRSMP